jgi:hypothetical protein
MFMTPNEVAAAVESALHPGRFFVAAPLQLRVEKHPSETCFWEVFRGHLLDRGQTRLEKTFTSWDVILDPPGHPVISVKYHAEEQRIYVVRYLEVYGFEAREEDGVIESRETKKWVRELVGTMPILERIDARTLEDQLCRLISLAIVGTSRLPITSLESPLPAFSLGKVAYLFDGKAPHGSPVRDPGSLLDMVLGEDSHAIRVEKLVEFALRAMSRDEIPRLVEVWLDHLRGDHEGPADVPELLFRSLFNHVALSPWTPFVEHLTQFLMALSREVDQGPKLVADLFSYMLRHLVRHLTSYDLANFHNMGANYPDALALDAFLRAYIGLIDQCPEAFAFTAPKGKLRRRALRQGWMMRNLLEGLAVPDEPTSPGENLRVLPEPFHRIPGEQLLSVHLRTKRLFEGQSSENLLTTAARQVFQQSLQDLSEESELRELGTGVFLDRPLGVFKQRGEVDRTPLLSYEAFSRSIAQHRLKGLKHWGVLPLEQFQSLSDQLAKLTVNGIPVTELPDCERIGVVSLEEAKQAAIDFVFTRTTRSSLGEFLNHLRRDVKWADLSEMAVHPLVIRTPRSVFQGLPQLLTAFDEQLQPRLDVFVVQNDGGPIRYREQMGVETLEDGLHIVPRTTR